jgi:hypothetical protein
LHKSDGRWLRFGKGEEQMKDPLGNFNWDQLYYLYDKQCRGFNPDSPYLLKQEFRVNSDRELYYALIKAAKEEFSSTGTLTFETYIGILYWKHYSFYRSKVCENACKEESFIKSKGLPELKYILSLVNLNDRNWDKMVTLMSRIGETRLQGIKENTSLPTRSTLLHFLYPEWVPIFDRMVLRAVGKTEEDANQKVEIFEEYVKFNWSLCEKYKDKIKDFKDTPVRIIEMALWVVR